MPPDLRLLTSCRTVGKSLKLSEFAHLLNGNKNLPTGIFLRVRNNICQQWLFFLEFVCVYVFGGSPSPRTPRYFPENEYLLNLVENHFSVLLFG